MEGDTSVRRNGEIDIFRFLFAVLVMFYHITEVSSVKLGANGWIGVEFFFVVSGLMLAKHAHKVWNKEELNIVQESWTYFGRRFSYIYKYYFATILVKWLYSLYDIIKAGDLSQIYKSLFASVPDIFLLSSFMYKKGELYLLGAWYLSVFFAVIFILYPLLLKYKEAITKIVSPIVFVFVFGMLMRNHGSPKAINQSLGIITSGFARGLAEMSLGILMYEIAESIRSKGVKHKFLMTVVKYVLFALGVYYAFSHLGIQKYGLSFLIIIALAVMLSFSQVGYEIKGNAFTEHLGKLSLVVFLTHGLLIENFDIVRFAGHDKVLIYIIPLIASVIFAEVFMFVCDLISSKFVRKK